jgi:hypothetical protein
LRLKPSGQSQGQADSGQNPHQRLGPVVSTGQLAAQNANLRRRINPNLHGSAAHSEQRHCDVLANAHGLAKLPAKN